MDKYINIKGKLDLNWFSIECITYEYIMIQFSAYVISYLEKMFYNLTTVALHNWRTYGEMRALAEHKVENVLEFYFSPQKFQLIKMLTILHIPVKSIAISVDKRSGPDRSCGLKIRTGYLFRAGPQTVLHFLN